MHMVASNNRTMQRILKISLAATLLYVAATLYFGIRAHSLALISEAGHNASDSLAIILSFVAVYFQSRPANPRKTFGYQRAGVLAAFVNALTLMVLAAWIGISAIARLYTPVTVQPQLMMYVAAAGVLMNGAIATLLWKFSGDVNIRSVFLHMLGDTLSTAARHRRRSRHPVHPHAVDRPGPLAHHRRHDPLVLLGHRPRDPQHPARRHPAQVLAGRYPGLHADCACVANVHDLHVWSLGSNSHALASHVCITQDADRERSVSECAGILDGIQTILWDKFHIAHTTIQFETKGCATTHGCTAPPELEAVGAHDHHHGHAH